MRIGKSWVLVSAISMFTLGTANAGASEISFSFAAAMGATETAGAPGANASHFNVMNTSTTITPVDNTGASVAGVSATTALNQFGTPNGGSGTNDAHLFSGFVDQQTNGASTLTVTGIPYAQYSVYVYMHNDTSSSGPGFNRTGKISVDGTAHFLRGPGGADPSFQDPSAGGGYTVSNDLTQTTAAGTTEGDYTVFTGLSGNLSVAFDVGLAGDGTPRDKFSGLQIVQTPEPASLGLLSLGGLALLRRRRSR